MSIKKTFQATKGMYTLTFSLPVSAATNATKVQLLGDFNNWDPQKAPVMKKGKEEYSIQIDLASPSTYQFRYLIDGERWQNDFSADGYVPSPFGGADNSVIILENPAKASQEDLSAPVKTAPKTVKKAAEKAKPVAKKEVMQKAAGDAQVSVKEVKPKKVVKTATSTKK